VWGIRALNLVNGIDVKAIKPRTPRKQDGTIKICCVAKFSPWHGYERLIRGLSDYYIRNPDVNVDLIMVGTGVETNKYKQLTQELHLGEHISFRGQLIGERLESVYDECDIGCCSLGRYKSGIDMTSELKSREFMAKGLPMICGCKIDVLEDQDYPYAIYFPNDATNIDISKVVDIYKNMVDRMSLEEMIGEIREFAMQHIDIHASYQPIVKEALDLC